MHGLGDGAVVLDAEVADAGGPDEILRVQQLGVGVGDGAQEPAAAVPLVAGELVGGGRANGSRHGLAGGEAAQ